MATATPKPKARPSAKGQPKPLSATERKALVAKADAEMNCHL